jgi:hypothetical protein
MNISNIFQKSNNNTLEQFQGIYRGFSPTDESPIALGELEVSIDKETIKLKYATGLEIVTNQITLSKLNPMTKRELKKFYVAESEYVDKSIGFSYEGMHYIFTPNASEQDIGLIIIGGMADMLGPTIAFSPSQIEQGIYKNAITTITEHYKDQYPKGCFPTLENNGKLPE